MNTVYHPVSIVGQSSVIKILDFIVDENILIYRIFKSKVFFHFDRKKILEVKN